MSTSIPLAPLLHSQKGQLSLAGPRLLVSIRNAYEARLARSAGVDWIDLKNPDGGSLGAADELTSVAVADELCRFSEPSNSAGCVRSAAVGELRDSPLATARYLAQHFSLLKVGLSGMSERVGWSTAFADLSQQLHSFGANLVPVIYADYELCSAPTPIQVIEVAEQIDIVDRDIVDRDVVDRDVVDRDVVDRDVVDRATDRRSDQRLTPAQVIEVAELRYLLIDTFTKDGRGLLDWLGVPELEAIIQRAAQAGRQVVLAGSLTQHDIPKLWSLPVAAIAVRGAVCANDRRSEVCPQKLQQWVELFRNG